ncbi:transcriptional regulator HexR [Escherichia coli]
MATLDHVRHSLDKSAINRAVDLLTQAKKIAFFGLGSSAAVAHDAMNKFFRFNVPVVYSDDIVLQRMSCMNCSDGDVVVLISHTGTKNLVELAQLALRKRRNGDCPHLCGYPARPEATLAITLDVPEDTDIYMPMVSRLAQLTVIDVLATGFTLRRGAKFRDNLKRVKEALKESRFDKQLLNLSDDRWNDCHCPNLIRHPNEINLSPSLALFHSDFMFKQHLVVSVNGVLHVQKASQNKNRYHVRPRTDRDNNRKSYRGGCQRCTYGHGSPEDHKMRG